MAKKDAYNVGYAKAQAAYMAELARERRGAEQAAAERQQGKQEQAKKGGKN